MAITVYTGYPGAGKSYALIEQVIIPALLAGRRVLTNIDGIKPDLCVAHAEVVARKGLKGRDLDHEIGTVETFSGEEAAQQFFWPTEAIADVHTRVKSGDLVVFDEWRLYVPKRGQLPNPDLEKFLRWHRHLVDAKGIACDVAIASQAITDIHPDFRALLERNYKFNKLRALGLNKSYAWFAWNGSSQAKGDHYAHGVGKYKRDIFPLYESYKGGQGTELKSSKRDDIWAQPKTWLTVLAPIPLLGIGGWKLYSVWSHPAAGLPTPAASSSPGLPAIPGQAAPAALPASSPWRIVGKVDGESGTRVIVTDDKGSIRMLLPGDFTFDDGRPVSGMVDGKQAIASDALPTSSASLVPLQ